MPLVIRRIAQNGHSILPLLAPASVFGPPSDGRRRLTTMPKSTKKKKDKAADFTVHIFSPSNPHLMSNR